MCHQDASSKFPLEQVTVLDYSLSGMTFNQKFSWNVKPTTLIVKKLVSFWNMTGASNCSAVGVCKLIFRGFKTHSGRRSEECDISHPAMTHYNHVIMGAMTSQITSLTIVYSTVYSGADQRKHQSSVSLAFCREFTGDRWIPRTNGQLRGKCFHLMTSSWRRKYL